MFGNPWKIKTVRKRSVFRAIKATESWKDIDLVI